ncbi:hypothetical protein Poli38472_013689 [Pythium oligandrum]|uniref:Uncharacterized protein n=1 Tax=Pythium oligandrum TaxID=41045 RepID=A0A8K1CE67_PYTOL|nr:hypothetical protein Poli38472_013689 [Pythium oligandrum]|eukprot:TMW61226.1 hypothetical protein Poli38472_013689 [Pythium oligandrum]
MSSLSALRDALTALGISTSTGDLRGEARRAALQQRLEAAQQGHSTSAFVAFKAPTPSAPENGTAQSTASFQHLSLTELRTLLEQRQLSTHTPGLKGDARRHALIQRLVNEIQTDRSVVSEPIEDDLPSLSARSTASTSSSTYSSAGEFLYFDLPSAFSSAKVQDPKSKASPSIPALRLSAKESQPSTETLSSDPTRQQFEYELIELRKELHTRRARRCELLTHRMEANGFSTSLESLSESMARLEKERQRLERSYYGRELVTTSIITEQPSEFVQADVIQWISKRQDQLRRQIHHTKDALAIMTPESNQTEEGIIDEKELLSRIQQLEAELCVSIRSSSSSWRSMSSPTPSNETPVLVRCQSLPANRFHETWQALDTPQRQQLHAELRSAASFRIQSGRVALHDGNTHNQTARTAAMPLFTQYPPTRADKLGIKARFLEQAARSVLEVNRTYKQALAVDGDHVANLTYYASFLYRRCEQPEQAESMLKRAHRLAPNSVLVLTTYAHFLHHKRQDIAKAEAFYQQAMKQTPQGPVVLGDYATLLCERAQKEEFNEKTLRQAKQLLQDVIRMAPSDLFVRLTLAGVLNQLKETQAAMKSYETLVRGLQQRKHQPCPAEKALMARICCEFARFLSDQGQYDRAKQHYQLALSTTPQDSSIARQFSLFLRDRRHLLTPTSRSSR